MRERKRDRDREREREYKNVPKASSSLCGLYKMHVFQALAIYGVRQIDIKEIESFLS